MSLYTFSSHDALPSLRVINELKIEECTDISLLSYLAGKKESEIISRLANDNLAFVAYINGQPAAFGWMARGKGIIGELGHEFILPISNRYLWNFRTVERFRGLGIYPLLLQYIMQYEGIKANRFWIIHAPENQASLKGIRKAGFRYLGNLYTYEGQAFLDAPAVSGEEIQLIEEMDFRLSIKSSPSCWSCSSPFIKREEEICCCLAEGKFCTSRPEIV